MGSLSSLVTAVFLCSSIILAQREVPLVQVGKNVQVSLADAKRTHYEVQVCADTNDKNYLLGVAMVAIPNDLFATQAYVSADEGHTWQLTFEEDHALNSFDPACSYGRNDDAFFLTIGFPGEEPRTNTFLLRSTDKGRTWHRIAELPRSVDRPYLTNDRSGGPHDGYLYVHGKRDIPTRDLQTPYRENLWIARSADRGRTFSSLDIPSLAKAIYVGRGVVMRDGTFAAVFGEIYDEGDARNSVKVVRFLADAAFPLAPVKVANWNIPQAPNAARSFAIAAGEGGLLYTAWEDGRLALTQVLFSRSTDGGATWSQPSRLTSSSSSPDHGGGFNPSIAVNRSGVVGMLWYDKRNHPQDMGWGVWFSVSLDRGKTFLPSVQVSEKDAVPGKGLGNPGRFSANGGDTSGLDAEPDGAFRAVWIDNRTGIPQVWTARILLHSR